MNLHFPVDKNLSRITAWLRDFSLNLLSKKIMKTIWYDNLLEASDELENGIEVERIYCFDWDLFEKQHYDELQKTFMKLPGNCKYIDDDKDNFLPTWFGMDEDSPPFLWASIEPPGLQVYGVLRKKDWEEWDLMFRNENNDLPMRKLEK
jgi:hypothetical protein